MEKNYKIFNFCLLILRCLGLSFSRVEMSKSGDKFIGKYSTINFILNMTIMSGFLYVLSQKSFYEYTQSKNVYKTSTIIFPLFTKMIVVTIILFILCGNIYNRKFIAIINQFPSIVKTLEKDFGYSSYKDEHDARKIIMQFLAYIGVAITFKILMEFHIVIHYHTVVRAIHYLCFFYGNFFTVHFCITMNYIRENYGCLNHIFKEISRETLQQASMPALILRQGETRRTSPREKLSAWMTGFMELREVEGLVNDVFGKQIFLTLFLAFSNIFINAYYFCTLNLYGTGNTWMSIFSVYGLFECVAVAWANTRAAEMAAKEANQINENIFRYPTYVDNWETYDQLKYFTLFNQNHPIEFRAWVFYSITYESLYKVIISSLAITTLILQCDFLRISLQSAN